MDHALLDQMFQSRWTTLLCITVNLDRCGEGYNTLNDSSDRLFISNNTEDINLQVFQNHN